MVSTRSANNRLSPAEREALIAKRAKQLRQEITEIKQDALLHALPGLAETVKGWKR